MATNKPYGDGHRQGAVRDRSQVYNERNDRWTKRDSDTGRFIDQKADKEPFNYPSRLYTLSTSSP